MATRSSSPAVAYDPEFPLAHRTDLPAHERGISREAWESLQVALADARARIARGEAPERLDLSELAPAADDDHDTGE